MKVKPYKEMTTEELMDEIKKRFTMPTDPKLQEAVKYLMGSGMSKAEAIGIINYLAMKHKK